MNIDDLENKDIENNSKKNSVYKKLAGYADKAIGFIKKHWLYFLIGAVVVIIVIIVLIVKGCGGRNSRNYMEESLGSVIAVETNDSSTAADSGINELQVDAYPQINELMGEYFRARLACDVDSLSKIVANTDSLSAEKLQKESEYIESYQGIKCYTKKGLLDNTYIVYVYFEYKFYNIDTTAPAMIRMYVCTNEAGDVYINNEAIDGEVASYLEEVNSSADVTDLFAQIDNKLQEAIESDENLKAFYQKLVEGVVTTEPETEAPTEAPTEAATEAPTEAVTEAPTEAPASDFTGVNDTAYVKQDAAAYSQPVADEQYRSGSVSSGERYSRASYNDKWAKLIRTDGTEIFVMSENLIIDENFIYVNETVYAKQTVRVRDTASYDAAVVGTLYKGESLKRIGYNDEWSKVIFEGDIYYIGKGFLTTVKPEE